MGHAVSCRQQLQKQRFEVYVCTAAERGYALEAWRILDPKVLVCSAKVILRGFALCDIAAVMF